MAEYAHLWQSRDFMTGLIEHWHTYKLLTRKKTYKRKASTISQPVGTINEEEYVAVDLPKYDELPLPDLQEIDFEAIREFNYWRQHESI